LRQEHLEGSLTLAELHFQQGQSAEALQTCRDIIDKDATSEAAFRLMMQIHQRVGDKAALIRAYRDCEENLQSVYGLPPSAETQNLFRKLVA